MARSLFFLLAIGLVLGGLWWVARGQERRRTGGAPAEPAVATPAPGARPDLIEPSLPSGVSRETPAPEDAVETANTTLRRAASRGSRRRAPIHGRLLIAPLDEPLAAVLTVRLRTADLSLKESVVTRPDGSFSTTKAFPRGYTLATVHRPAGDAAFEHEAWFDPASDAEWPVRGPWPTFARGRVVDRAGQPLEGVDVALVGGAAGEPIRSQTDAGGRFRLQGLEPGPCALSVSRDFERTERSFTALRGPNELGDVVVRFRELAGEISGVLRGPARPRALVRLEDRDSGYVDTRIVEPDEDGEAAAVFRFPGVLAGEYVLSVTGMDGARYAPAALAVAPPRTGLEFHLAGETERFRPPVRGLDSLAHATLVRVDGRWLAGVEGLARADVERWIVLLDGFQPVTGSGAEAANVAEHEIEPEPGWGQAFLFVEAAGDRNLECGFPPIAGASVIVDGRPVAVSGADGLALARLPEEPDSVEYELAGWTLHDSDGQHGLMVVALRRD